VAVEDRAERLGLDDGGPRIDTGEGRVEEAALQGGDPRRRVGRVVEKTFRAVELQDLVTGESTIDGGDELGVVGSLGSWSPIALRSWRAVKWEEVLSSWRIAAPTEVSPIGRGSRGWASETIASAVRGVNPCGAAWAFHSERRASSSRPWSFTCRVR
jgi:hypothetical protein